MVQKYQGTENEEQEQELVLITHLQSKKSYHVVYGVFRNVCSEIDNAKHKNKLYRFQNADGEWSAVDPNLIFFVGEVKENENQD